MASRRRFASGRWPARHSSSVVLQVERSAAGSGAGVTPRVGRQAGLGGPDLPPVVKGGGVGGIFHLSGGLARVTQMFARQKLAKKAIVETGWPSCSKTATNFLCEVPEEN